MERKHKHLLEVCRALLFKSNLLIHSWGECLLTTTFLISRFPSKILNMKTPYELLLGYSPNYFFLRSFDCLCYASMLSVNKIKLNSISIKYMFLRYPYRKKDYNLLNSSNNDIFMSQDIVFHENFCNNPLGHFEN